MILYDGQQFAVQCAGPACQDVHHRMLMVSTAVCSIPVSQALFDLGNIHRDISKQVGFDVSTHSNELALILLCLHARQQLMSALLIQEPQKPKCLYKVPQDNVCCYISKGAG